MSDYWKEWLRVNTDRIILAILIVLMLAVHAEEKLIYMAIGGLIGAIQHNRWQEWGKK